jgi:Spy/CpxP family protein refolding chaperone
MNRTQAFSKLAACGLAAALAATAPALSAEPQSTPQPQYGPGMMGPGMMGGGMGPGMMGGYGMGPGMMGGYGMGPGMGMMGHGMMGGYWGSGLDLSAEQQARINKIQDETRKSHWNLMGEMMNQQSKLRDLYQAPQRDSAAVDAAHKEIGKLQQKMYDASVEAHKRMEAVLTKEQMEKQRSYWRGGGTPGTPATPATPK